MLTSRLLVAIGLIPLAAAFIWLGGLPLALLVTVMLAVAGWEYGRIFQHGGYAPAQPLLVIFPAGLALWRHFGGLEASALPLAAAVLTAMTWHIIQYERGCDQAAANFAVTLSGIAYLGWLGSYLVSLRALPDGMYWMLLALPGIAIADSGAFFIGRRFGRRKLAPRTSPKKTWEGYLGGILTGGLGTMGLAALWHLNAPSITPIQGLLLGVIVSAVCPLGDLGESLIKRQFHVKDSSHLLAGHGGMLDRIDSWLWAAAVGYYLISWFWLAR